MDTDREDIDVDPDVELRRRACAVSIRRDKRREVFYFLLMVFYAIPVGILLFWNLAAHFIWLFTSVRFFDPVLYLTGVP